MATINGEMASRLVSPNGAFVNSQRALKPQRAESQQATQRMQEAVQPTVESFAMLCYGSFIPSFASYFSIL